MFTTALMTEVQAFLIVGVFFSVPFYGGFCVVLINSDID